jgi:glycolate oxidase iron-sulfur subunit
MSVESDARGAVVKPQLNDLDRCTRCGLCEQSCPTYRLLHFEPDSPRGRVYLMKQVAEGESEVTEHFAHHLYQCLGCRACETACPAGVPFGKLLEQARSQIEARGEISSERKGWKRFRTLAFETILPKRWMFNATMLPARALQGFPAVLRLVQALPLPSRMKHLVRMIPRNQDTPWLGGNQTSQSSRESRGRVGLFLGCVMRSLFRRVHQSTIRVLRENDYEVVIPNGQWCCGALNVHAGERVHAAAMARRNIRAFANGNLDAIVVNSAGCGAHLKEYSQLLGDDPEVQAFSSKIRDVTEFLGALELKRFSQPVRKRVTYQDACHLIHGQRVKSQPRRLLGQIPGVEFVELRGSDGCCGAAGVYSLTHPALSQAILDSKLSAVAESGADVVATTNPGCALQLQAGLLGRKARTQVCHVVELLADAYMGP